MIRPDPDNPERAAQRANQTDPQIMYMVVERETALDLGELLQATVRASNECVRLWADDPRYSEGFRAWLDESYRKVVLKARPGQWRRLLEQYDLAWGGTTENPGLLCLPPRRRSARSPLLQKLQTLSAEAGLSQLGPSTPTEPDRPLFVINSAAEMSSGKLLAQVGHAALMLAEKIDMDEWRKQKYRAEFAAAVNQQQTADLGAARVVVRDAGLTEVAAGTETVWVY